MAKRRYTKKSNMKDTSLEVSSIELSDFAHAISTDPNQIDLETQIEEEEKEEVTEIVEEKEYPAKLTKFKNPLMEVQIQGISELVTNENITEGDIEYMINNNIMSESEFK